MTEPIVVAVEFLAAHLEWMRHSPAVDEFLTDVEACGRVVRGLARGPAPQRYLGPCGAVEVAPSPGATLEFEYPACEGDVYAREGASSGRCRVCSAEWSTATRRAWLDAEVRSWAYRASEIANAYGINVKTLRSWADRGQLAQHGEDREGRPLYNLGEALDLAAGDAARREGDRATRARRTAARAAESETAA